MIHIRIGNHTAIRHEQNPSLADPGVFHFHDHATGGGLKIRRHLDDLKQRPQDTARDVRSAGNQAIGLVHRQHHRPVEIRLQQRLARLGRPQPLLAAQGMEPFREILQILAGGRVDDADALQRKIQIRRHRPDFLWISQHNGRPQPQCVKLPRGLQNPGFFAFRKHHPLRMALQFIDDVVKKTHGAKVIATGQSAKSIRRRFASDSATAIVFQSFLPRMDANGRELRNKERFKSRCCLRLLLIGVHLRQLPVDDPWAQNNFDLHRRGS